MPFTPHAHPGTLHHYLPRLVAFEHIPKTSSPLNLNLNPNPSRDNTYTAISAPANAPAPIKNYLLFLGGLGEGLSHPHYPSLLAEALSSATGVEQGRQWSVVEVLLSSSYTGWTTSTLQRDAEELESAVQYFRDLQQSRTEQSDHLAPSGEAEAEAEGKGATGTSMHYTEAAQAGSQGKIALLGHSTGCQVILQYLVGSPFPSPSSASSSPSRPPIDGIILQAGISDREALTLSLPSTLSSSLTLAKSMVASGQASDHLPFSQHRGVFEAAPSAERWVSLVEPGGGDDFFSSDLGDDVFERTFGEVGRMGVRVCVLFSGEDENVPGWVDKEGLVGRWERAVRHGWEAGQDGDEGRGGWDEASAVVKGAKHDPSACGEEVLRDVFERVRAFLGRC